MMAKPQTIARRSSDIVQRRPENGKFNGRVVVITYWAVLLAALAIALVLVSTPVPRLWVGVLAFVLLLLLLLAKVPIGIGMMLAALPALWSFGGYAMVASTFGQLPYTAVASWQLSVIPLFVLMGVFLWKSGVTGYAYTAAHAWLGRLPGGLAVATNFAGAGLAACSGSTIGVAYGLGKMAIPEMIRAGYKPSLAGATVAAAGTLGQLIPPSVMLVVYAGIAQTPVGTQLLAALVPSLALAFCYGALIVCIGLVRPADAPRATESPSWSARFRSLIGVLPLVGIIVLVLGGMFGGVFTPTEAGAFGAIAAFCTALFALGRSRDGFRKVISFSVSSLTNTVTAVAAIFLLLIGINILNRVFTLSGIPQALTGFVVDLGLSPVAFLLVLTFVYLLLGMFLDPFAIILLTVPLLQAPLTAMGIDMLWFGVYLVVLVEIAVLTPPLGVLSFIVHRIMQSPEVNLGKRVTLTDVFMGVLPFVAVATAFVVVLIFVPDIALWLPSISVPVGE